MMCNTSKVIKYNLHFFLFFIFLLHSFYTNLIVFQIYWEEKLYWQNLRTGKYEYWIDQTSFSFKDYNEYGTKSLGAFLPYFTKMDIGEFFLYCLFLLLFLLYVGIPIFFNFLKMKITFKYCFIVDLLILFISCFIFLKQILYKPMIGVIPIYVFNPTMILILIYFRIYQYKKKLIF